MTATRSPAAGRHRASAIVKSQVLPNASATVPVEESDLAASASVRVAYEYRCQNTGSSGNFSIG
jgi:hypothetical protein